MITWTPSDPHAFFCTVCSRQVNCRHMGRSDVERHVTSKIHKSNGKSIKSQTTLPLLTISSSVNEKVSQVTSL